MQQLPEAKGHDLHLSSRQRLQILSKAILEGKSTRVVASETGVAHSTVDYTVKKWNETGDIHEHLSGGPGYAYDDNDFYKLECLMDQNPAATADDLISMMGTSTPHVDATTIRRYRRILGYTQRKPRVWVIDTERTARLRREWALTHKDDNHANWVYMDESTLCLRHTGDLVWVKRGEPTPAHQIESLKCSVNIWGIIWNNGSHFEFYEGSLTKERYIEMLEASFIPLQSKIRNRVVLQDMHPAHNSKLAKQWVANHRFNFLFGPPHSPQFNSIEEVWAWIKHQVKKQRPSNAAELKAACEHAWRSLPRQDILSYISHASRMIKEAASKQD